MRCLRREGERSEPKLRRHRVISQETWMDIKTLTRQGMSVLHNARTTGLSRVTVRRALMLTVPKSYGPGPARPGKLTPYEGYLLEQLQGRPWARAT